MSRYLDPKADVVFKKMFNDHLHLHEDNWDSVRREKTLFLEGIEKGKAVGKAEGIAEGIEKEKTEIARNLLKNNLPIEIIINATGLSEKAILDLKMDNLIYKYHSSR